MAQQPPNQVQSALRVCWWNEQWREAGVLRTGWSEQGEGGLALTRTRTLPIRTLAGGQHGGDFAHNLLENLDVLVGGYEFLAMQCKVGLISCTERPDILRRSAKLRHVEESALRGGGGGGWGYERGTRGTCRSRAPDPLLSAR